ncbi:MAG: hypothetical protein KDD33_06325 [Bdellovibrionales bacterium]|nr:hypothetical protein [Bdellovibrionales bacterium]
MKIIILILSILTTLPALAKYEAFVSKQIIEEKVERKARREAIDKATKETTLEQIKKMIGEQRFKENKSKIDSEILSLQNRFIPFFKILKYKQVGETFEFDIEVKVSTTDLRQVLQQKGLFASSTKTGITLPFVEFNNRISGESYRWWAPSFTTQNELESLSLKFESELFQGFLDKGLFLLRPQAFSMVNMVPDVLRKTFLTQTEMVQLTGLQNGQLYLDGKVDIISSPLRENAYRIRVQMSCRQSGNGKSVAEVVRTFDAASGIQMNQLTNDVKRLAQEIGKDIAGQVYDLWQRGVLESQTVQLAVTGNLDNNQLDHFKKSLSESVNGIQGLRERLFEPGRVTFELDYEGGVELLKSQLEKTQIEGFMSQVVSVNAEQITLDVKSK